MFENTNVSRIYNEIKKLEKLSIIHKKIIFDCSCASFFLIGFSIISGIFLREIKSPYIGFIIIPIATGIVTLFVPALFKKFSKKSKIENIYENLVNDLSQNKTQIELINFFDFINIDNKYLKLQFAHQNYKASITELNILLSNKIYKDKLQKQAIKENELINNYEKKLKEKENPKLKLVN